MSDSEDKCSSDNSPKQSESKSRESSPEYPSVQEHNPTLENEERIQELEEELRGIKRVNEERPEKPIEKRIKIAPSTSSSHDEAGPSKKFLSHEEWEKKFEKFKTEMEAKFEVLEKKIEDQEEEIKLHKKKIEDQEEIIKVLEKKIEDQEIKIDGLNEELDIAHAQIATLEQENLRLSRLVQNQGIIANQPLAVNGHQVEEPQILPNDHQPQGLHLQGGIANQLLLAALNADPAPQHPPLGINPQVALEEDVDEEDGDEP